MKNKKRKTNFHEEMKKLKIRKGKKTFSSRKEEFKKKSKGKSIFTMKGKINKDKKERKDIFTKKGRNLNKRKGTSFSPRKEKKKENIANTKKRLDYQNLWKHFHVPKKYRNQEIYLDWKDKKKKKMEK